MPRLLYTGFYYLITPLILLRLAYRAWRAPDYAKRIPERFGFYGADKAPQTPIWIHAVSVGETLAAAPLIRQLLQHYPQQALVITTMTPTGSARVKALFAEHLGERVFHVYAPYDLPGALQRFLKHFKPQLLVIMETELWPNMLHYSRRNNCQVLLANARLSEKSARGYRRVAALSRSMLRDLSLAAIQSQADAQRLIALGLPPAQALVSGSIKFDIDISPELREKAQQLQQQWQAQQPREVWIAASTHEGEEAILLAAHRQLLQHKPNALLVIVPRHPERFGKVLHLAEREGFSVAQRSTGQVPTLAQQVLLADTMGELLVLLGAAQLTYFGGSLIERGGHNMLEAAAWGLPILSGPSVYNFQEISEKLEGNGALLWVRNADECAAKLQQLFTDPAQCARMGAAASAVVDANRGALQQLISCVDKLLKP